MHLPSNISSNISTEARRQLDDPIWSALTGEQSGLAVGTGLAVRYPTGVAPFAAIGDTTPQAFEALRELIPSNGRLALVTTRKIEPPRDLVVQSEAFAYQMIATRMPPDLAERPVICGLGPSDVPDMLRLVELTHPGPFGRHTQGLGHYIGIRIDGELAAMAGERIRFGDFVEISAVCVHPDHRGKGYARTLIRELMRAQIGAGLVPFLHVFESNKSAVALYERLGFVVRQRLHITGLSAALRSPAPSRQALHAVSA